MASAGTISLSDGAIRDKHISADAAIDPDKMGIRDDAVVTISPLEWRVWDALQTNLPGTAATDDLALHTGTWGTDAPYITSDDVKNTTTTRRAACIKALPSNYADAQGVKILAWAGMQTTVASSSCTVDFEVWRIDHEDGTLGSADLVSTAAQTINSLTEDDVTFDLTTTTLSAGDLLYIRMTIACTDSATVTAVIPSIWTVQILADTRG